MSHGFDDPTEEAYQTIPDGSARLHEELTGNDHAGPEPDHDDVIGGSADSTLQSTAATAINGNTGNQWSRDTQTAVREFLESVRDGNIFRAPGRWFGNSANPSFGQVVSHAGDLLESYYAERFPRGQRYRPQGEAVTQRIDDNTRLVSLILRSPRVGRHGIQGYGEPYRHGLSFLITNNNDGTVSVRPFRDGNGPPGVDFRRIDNGRHTLRLHALGPEVKLNIRR